MSLRQEFHTANVFRIRIADDPAAGEVINACLNPSGAYGGWWWSTPVADTTMESVGSGPTLRLRYTTLAAQLAPFVSAPIAMEAGQTIEATYTEHVSTAWHRTRWSFFDAFGGTISSSTQSAYRKNTALTAARTVAVATAPANTAYARMRVDIYSTNAGATPTAGQYVDFNQVQIAVKTTGTETLVDQPYNTIDATNVTISRDALNVGIMTIRVQAEDFDDVVLDYTPGREIIAEGCWNVGADYWVTLYAGTTADISAELQRRPSGLLRVDATITCTDNTTTLARIPSASSVVQVGELAGLLEIANPAMPWVLNGDDGTIGGIAVEATDTSAKLLDQIIRTRDTQNGFGWVDRLGRVNVVNQTYANAFMLTPVDTLDQDDYNGSARTRYDTRDVINSVEVVNWSGTTSTQHGPYLSQYSVKKYGIGTATYTVIDVADPAGYALDVLGTGVDHPAKTLPEATIALTTEADVTRWILRDLYDCLDVTRPDGFSDDMWITGIDHSISRDKWLLTLRLAKVGRAALPTT